MRQACCARERRQVCRRILVDVELHPEICSGTEDAGILVVALWSVAVGVVEVVRFLLNVLGGDAEGLHVW